MANLLTPRQKVINEVRLMLGDGMIDIELTPEYYDLALDLALERYFQRSANSTDERIAFIELQPDQVDYVLPNEVTQVRNLYRRGTTGTASGTGVNFDPFGAAFVNQTALGLGTGPGSGSLITYELFSGYQELVGRMFGLHINYSWNVVTHTLSLVRHVRAKETLMAHVEVIRTEDHLLADPYARPWLRDWMVGRCKIFLGEARGLFGSWVGPQGGTTLNGAELKAEGQAELERLEQEIKNFVDQDEGYGFIIG